MTNEQIIDELKESIKLLLPCTEDEEMKAKLKTILNGNIIHRCKCPRCGEKFEPKDNMKYATKIL